MLKKINIKNSIKSSIKNSIMQSKASSRDYNNVILTDKSNFSIVEAYKTTRTNLTYALMNSTDKCKKIIFYKYISIFYMKFQEYVNKYQKNNQNT